MAAEMDLNALPPKGLIALFGDKCLGTMLRNVDEPADGVFDVIKDPNSGDILRIKNPRTGRWVRYEKGIAQRLRQAAEDGAPVMEEDADKGKRPRSPSPPPAARPRPRPRVKKAKRSPSPEIPSLLPKRLDSPKPADGAKLEKIVEEMVEKKLQEKKVEEEKKAMKQKEARRKWRVATKAVRASVRLQGGAPEYEALDFPESQCSTAECSQSQHTGLTLIFDDLDME